MNVAAAPAQAGNISRSSSLLTFRDLTHFSPLPRNGDSIRGHDLVTYLALPASVASGRTRQTLSPRQMCNGFCNALDMDFHSMFCNGLYQ